MKNQDQLLKHILGEKGLDKLSKSMYRRDSKSILSPIDMYLPLLAVPRALLSWLAQNVQSIEIGESKTLNIPTMAGIDINIQKTGRDAYSAQFVEEGKVVHTFENQTLPAVGGHLMSIGELYDYSDDSSALDVPSTIMQYSGVQGQVPDNVSAILSPVLQMLGKVIDALVAKQMVQTAVDEVLVEKAAVPMSEAPSGQAGPVQPHAAQDPYKPSKNPQKAVNQTKEQRQDRFQPGSPAMTKNGYFRSLKKKTSHFQKTESGCVISEDLLYTPCNECGIPEFSKTESGPKYKPCACFQVTLENSRFVSIKKSESTGLYEIKFTKKQDKELITAFLLTLKDRLDHV